MLYERGFVISYVLGGADVGEDVGVVGVVVLASGGSEHGSE